MRRASRKITIGVFVPMTLFLTVGFATAQPSESSTELPEGVVGADLVFLIEENPLMPVDELRIAVRPLSRDQLSTTAALYDRLLRAKVAEISAAELAAKRAATPAEEQPAPAADAPPTNEGVPAEPPESAAASTTAEPETTADWLAEAARLRDQRVVIVDRFRVVLDALEARGGDIAEYKQYVAAVSGITLTVTDAAGTYSTIINWLKSPEGGIRWAKNIAAFILTLLAFWVIARIIDKTVGQMLKRGSKLSTLMREFVAGMISRIILFVGLIVAIAWLEVEIGPILAIIGAAGFVVAFALQGTLSNFASGIMILAYRPFDVGDAVTVAGVSGIVDSMNLVSTNIRTFDNQKMVVPNNEIWGNVITNITGMPTRRLDMVFGIAYSDDAEKAMGILDEVVRAHPLTLPEPEPTIKLHELGNSSVDLICRPWVKTSDYWALRWDVIKTVKERFDKEGITIPFPQRDVHIFQESGA